MPAGPVRNTFMRNWWAVEVRITLFGEASDSLSLPSHQGNPDVSTVVITPRTSET